MNLQEFFNYRKDCPICNNTLATNFHSLRRQSVRYEDDRYVVFFTLDSFCRTKGNKKSYKVAYSFGLNDNSIIIEFYNVNYIKYHDMVPLFLIKRFKELHGNLRVYKIYKHCLSCKNYEYNTKSFFIDYKSGFIDELSIHSENFVMLKRCDDGYKIYNMLNVYDNKETIITYGKLSDPNLFNSLETVKYKIRHLVNPIKTSIIPFVSYENNMDRISTLITFS